MSWIQLLIAILGSGGITALIAGILDVIGIKQTNKFNQQRFDNDKKLAEDKLRLEEDRAAAQDLYRIIKGGFIVLPLIQEKFTYIDGGDDYAFTYKNFAYKLVQDINRDNLEGIKSDLDRFIRNLIAEARDTVNDHKIEDCKIVDYFLELVISDLNEHKEDYKDFKARYMTSTYRYQAELYGIGWNYIFDVKKLNSDIDFVNKILNLHIEPIKMPEHKGSSVSN